MDIKRVQDSDKFAIIIDEKEMNVFQHIMQIDERGIVYPFYIDVTEYLQRIEYDNSRRRSAQTSTTRYRGTFSRSTSPAISVSDIRRMQDALDQADVQAIQGLQVNSYIIDDTLADIGDPVDGSAVSSYTVPNVNGDSN